MKPQPYGPFAYKPIKDRPKLNWPDGARVAFWVVPNIEYYGSAEANSNGIKPTGAGTVEGLYGGCNQLDGEGRNQGPSTKPYRR